jgi:hypothetical protein
MPIRSMPRSVTAGPARHCAAGQIPEAFRPTGHIFYGQRVVDVDDALPIGSGHKNASEKIGI